MYSDLKGKTGVVTGSSSGIGAAIINRFAKEEMPVVINYYGEEEAAMKMVSSIQQNGGKAIAVHADVKNENDINNLLQTTIDAFGRLDVWVNNAGIERPFSSHEMPLKEWQAVIDTNLTGVFLGARAALNYFIKENRKGNIINISSIHEIIPRPMYVHYAASKGGIKQLTRTLALEYARKGIRVNEIAPGAIITPINEMSHPDPESKKRDGEGIPVGYLGRPEQIANVAVWLASEESNYVTGTTIVADGGFIL